MELYQRIAQRIEAIAEEDRDGETEAIKRKLFEIERFFAEFSEPMNFDSDSPDNAALVADNNFEALCATLESNGVQNAANLTAHQFYARLEHFKKMARNLKSL